MATQNASHDLIRAVKMSLRVILYSSPGLWVRRVLELAKVVNSFKNHYFREILMVFAVRKANHLPAGNGRTALSELGRGRDKENDFLRNTARSCLELRDDAETAPV